MLKKSGDYIDCQKNATQTNFEQLEFDDIMHYPAEMIYHCLIKWNTWMGTNSYGSVQNSWSLANNISK